MAISFSKLRLRMSAVAASTLRRSPVVGVPPVLAQPEMEK
jgi:hypothetical protein